MPPDVGGLPNLLVDAGSSAFILRARIALMVLKPGG
jgi:hypothetical protein